MTFPLSTEIPWQDPVHVFARFAQQSGSILLESAQYRAGFSRYSFIAVDPFQVLSSKNGVINRNNQTIPGNPFDVLAEQLAQFALTNHADQPPFQGGVAGFFSYELYQHLETIASAQSDEMEFPDLLLGFYDVVMAFDHTLQRVWIYSSGYPLRNEAARKERAHQRLQALLMQLQIEQAVLPETTLSALGIQTNFSQSDYCAAVQIVKDYILAGDIFEANISQRFQTQLPPGLMPFHLYQRLRELNPAPFAAFLNFNEYSIASASPERFLQLRARHVESRPIKGTRPRGKNATADSQLADELVKSEKDQAENIMIVDLLRNDLSRVCEDHTVKVPQLCGLESYATVHHLVSIVTGKLRDNLHAVDLLKATFPGGSITGAPKIRAMEIIAEIEPTHRGPYCGSVGYIGFNGDMDTSITIRTFAIKNNCVTFQAGGAIVADSDPLGEYEETLVKAKALLGALAL